MLLALLFFIQDVELDALGHPDPEERLRAAAALRRSDALPLLLRGRRHSDPEIRARVDDVLRGLSPLAWVPHRTSKAALDVLRSQLAIPEDAPARAFLDEARGRHSNLLQAAGSYGQAMIPVGAFRQDLDNPREDVDFRLRDGVIWAGYRRDLEADPDLLGWTLGHLDDPAALSLLAQLLSPAREAALLDDPRPEAVDLLLTVHALRPSEGPLDPRFAPRLAARLRTLDAAAAGTASVVLRARALELAPLLNEGAGGSNRWWRHLSAAIAASTHGFPSDPAAFNGLLRVPESETRREAVRAVLARLKPETWDCAALLEAGENPSDVRHFLRLSRERRLQAAAVDFLGRTPEASLAVLEDCDDPEILDAAVLAFRGHPALLARSTSVLRRMTETGDDPAPRLRLKEIFDGTDGDAAARAAFALGGLPAGEILGFLRERLYDDALTLRVNALYGLRRVGSRVEPDSCLATHLRDVLRSRAEIEPDLSQAHNLRQIAEGAHFAPHMPHRLVRMTRVFGCGGGRLPQGRWKPLPPPAVPLPAWKD